MITAPKFIGTDNPRYLRAIQGLLTRAVPRKALDDLAGCANGPDLIKQLRDLFPPSIDLHKYIACTRLDEFIDRDGRPCRPGVYHLTVLGRRLVIQWLARRNLGGQHA